MSHYLTASRPGCSSGAVTADVLSGAVAAGFLARYWPALYAAAPAATPYQAPDWLAAWIPELPSLAALLCVVVRDAGQPVAALAMARRWETDGGSVIEPLGSPQAEYIQVVGPAAEDPVAVRPLAGALAGLAGPGTRVRVDDLPENSTLARVLAGAGEWEAASAWPCATVPLPLSLDGKDLAASTRKQHRRRSRTWGEFDGAGRVAYVRSRTAEELGAGVEDLLRLCRARRPDGMFTAPWARVLRRCGPRLASVALLRLDGAPVAAQLLLGDDRSVEGGPRVYSLLAAFDPDPGIARLGPGHALQRYCAEDLAAYGYRVLDLGRTLPHQVEYKQQYGPVWSSTKSFAVRDGTRR